MSYSSRTTCRYSGLGALRSCWTGWTRWRDSDSGLLGFGFGLGKGLRSAACLNWTRRGRGLVRWRLSSSSQGSSAEGKDSENGLR